MRHFWRFVRLLWRNRKKRGQVPWRIWLQINWIVSGIFLLTGLEKYMLDNIAPFLKRITEKEDVKVNL